MTKDHYYEMCEMLGSTPGDDVPVEFEDLPQLVQVTLGIYDSLNDTWDYMGGNYIGKDQHNLFKILDLYLIPEEERLIVYKLINIIDTERRVIIRNKTPKT